MKEITVEELLSSNQSTIIDVRSPIEFEEEAIPGAINIPLFTNEERQEIGIIYKYEGQSAAKWKAMEVVSPKIPSLLKAVKENSEHGILPVIHCWRGGLRSRSFVTFLEFAGIPSQRLLGGYKAYRQHILKELPDMYPKRAVVLHGMTGVGKTEILKILNAKGFPTMDLEKMAGHRGSIFGTIGLGEGHNQKTFDSLLFQQLFELKGTSYFIMEAESKRIGRIVQPEELMERKFKGIHFLIHTPMVQRVKHIVEEYVLPFEHMDWYHEKIFNSMERIARRLQNKEVKSSLFEKLSNRQYSEMIGLLLEHYYDPMYNHKLDDYEGGFTDIYAENPSEASKLIENKLNRLQCLPVR